MEESTYAVFSVLEIVILDESEALILLEKG